MAPTPATQARPAGPGTRSDKATAPAAVTARMADAWLRSQSLNTARHILALRPFHPAEFGTGPAAPSPAHVAAANRLLGGLREQLRGRASAVRQSAAAARARPTPRRLRAVVERGEEAHHVVRACEQVWDWFFEFFGQRQSRYASWLLACDRIALDVYQDVYMGLGRSASIPSPAPMAYMRTGFSPATFRRDVRLRRLGLQPNPFPIVQLPYHRLVNPWTLGAILHEVSHNLQNELGLAQAVPRAVGDRLVHEGLPRAVAETWVRWNRETFADLLALLLGGPAVVASLIDILARSPRSVTSYNARAVHPLPLLRTRISTELLSRMGFDREAAAYRQLWDRIYHGVAASAPASLLATAPRAIPLVVDVMCFQPYPSLGDKPLAGVFIFDSRHQAMVTEAGRRLATGVDPGIVPERFLIGAARYAIDHRLADPDVVAANFYRDLARR
jgi:hypothetical protein